MKKITFITLSYLLICMQLFSQKTVIQDYRYTVYFDTNQDQLTPDAKLNLEQRLADFVQKDIVSIEIVGHTDIEGSLDFNLDLSKRRAEAVQRFIQKNGMEVFPTTTSFLGETSPQISDNSPSAKAANRRVEIWWMVKEVMPPQEGDILSSVTTYEKIIPDVKSEETNAPLSDYQKFHQQMDKESQYFNVNNAKGGILEAKEGTIIHFYPNSFCNCKNKENINGNIKIVLREYYQLGDFLKAGLNTRSNNNTLQSAGTIHISAFANDEKVCLKKGQDYEILFPKYKMNQKVYDDMQLFVGNIEEDGEINWGVMRRNSLLNRSAVMSSRNTNNRCYPHDRSKMKFFKRTKIFFSNHFSWKTYKFWRSEDGKKLAEKNLEECQEELKRQKKLVADFNGSFSELVKELKKTGLNSEEYIFNYYITSANQLNYINCDRFLRRPKEKLHTVNLTFKGHEKISPKLIIRPYNSIAQGTPYADGYHFPNLPKGEKAQIILYDYSGKSPRLAKLDIVIGKTIHTKDIVFQEYNLEDFKRQLVALN